ncbi:MAG: DUF4351 domain-containing protein [Acidobacteria bacterium]|nr:DUF4351 domain-containing protein [Acidobacteriota bacterium]
MPARSTKTNLDQDNAWKDMLDRHFQEFMQFFFPEIHAAIDWSRKPVFLDKELAKLGPKHLRGKRLADKLAKVWSKTGKPLFVVLHSEIQGQAGAEFNERMYVYNYRIKDREDCPVVSLGIITGGASKIEIGRYETELWGCQLVFIFPVARLVDWRGREQELLASDNPFAMVVLAHLKVIEAKGDVNKKYLVKRELLLLLGERGYSDEAIYSLLRFLDWLIRLPEELAQKLEDEIEEITEGKRMPYVTSWERRGEKRGKKIGEKQGLLDAVTLQLKRKFGKLDADIKARLEKLSVARLKKLVEALLDFSQPDDLERWLKRKAG